MTGDLIPPPPPPPISSAIPLILRSAVNFQGQEDKGFACRLGGRSELSYTGNPAETPSLDAPVCSQHLRVRRPAGHAAKEKIPSIQGSLPVFLWNLAEGSRKQGCFKSVCVEGTRVTCTYYTGIYMEERKPRQRGAQTPPGCWEAGKTPGDAPRSPVACFYRAGD